MQPLPLSKTRRMWKRRLQAKNVAVYRRCLSNLLLTTSENEFSQRDFLGKMTAKRSATFFIFISHISLHLCQQLSPSRDFNEPGEAINRRGPSNLPLLERLESPQTFYPCLLSGDSSGFSSWCGDNKDPSEEPDINDPVSFGEGLRNVMAEQAQSLFNPDTFPSSSISSFMEPSVNSLSDNVAIVQSNGISTRGTVGRTLLSPTGSQQSVAGLQPSAVAVPIQTPSVATNALSANSMNIQPVGTATSGTRTIGGAPLASAPFASASLDSGAQRSSPLLFSAPAAHRLIPLAPVQPFVLGPAEEPSRYRLAHLRHRLLRT
uniref:BZIP domain-containing protein n=1 Tax=Ascaris lumbricoides TaxID=6252 RepID=A0A0M3HQ71_ASCLU